MAEAVEIKKDELFKRFCRRIKKDITLYDFLEDAERQVIRKAYPFGATEAKVAAALKEYSHVVINVADYIYSKDGAIGETQHTAAGVTRQYGGAGVPSDFFYDIIPEVGVL